ncbi:hypothetical protein [Mycobacterium colombiense]|uniref:Uncharacterized protein n=1 Tax=Mycobacterium colombiense TaxID=339268 RepID=A0A1A2YUY8_9MYCO|nr:hypothetical protein [Mycobacterium colombiense]OBI41238.1 hypothetical protein A5708_02210 [Mycobacterium colombiense]
MSARQGVGAAELSRGNPAAANYNNIDGNIDPRARPEGGVFGLRLHWPTRGRGFRRWRRGRAVTLPASEIDYGIRLFR